jgi:hypothetical protein
VVLSNFFRLDWNAFHDIGKYRHINRLMMVLTVEANGVVTDFTNPREGKRSVAGIKLALCRATLPEGGNNPAGQTGSISLQGGNRRNVWRILILH